MKAIIRLSDENGDNGVTYVVTDKPRVGMGTPEAYRSEVARILAMGEAAGRRVEIVETPA